MSSRAPYSRLMPLTSDEILWREACSRWAAATGPKQWERCALQREQAPLRHRFLSFSF